MRGRSDELKATTDRMLGTRGVLHGGAEYVAETLLSPEQSTAPGQGKAHAHGSEAPHARESKPARRAKVSGKRRPARVAE